MTSRSLLFALMVVVCASGPAYSQDAAVVDSLAKALGTPLPATLHITAAGSAYVRAECESGTRRHVRIQTFSQDVDFAGPRLTERAVILDTRPGAPQPTITSTRAAAPDAAWGDQYALWTTPAGFISAATSRPRRITTETVFGRPYRVVIVTTPGGREVRGYVNEDNVLERTRTEIDNAAGTTVRYEAIYLDWQDFGGVKYPSVIIQKEDDELARILVVDNVAATGPSSGEKTAATH
jgi:hypothetical protein